MIIHQLIWMGIEFKNPNSSSKGDGVNWKRQINGFSLKY